MHVQIRRHLLAAGSAVILLCGSPSVVHGSKEERQEPLLHVPGAVLLLGYPEDQELYLSSDGEDLRLQVPGPKRAGHHTYPSLSRDGSIVATSYVKGQHPNYHEGLAIYSRIEKRWQLYDIGDFHFVWAVSLSPDGSTLAFKAER